MTASQGWGVFALDNGEIHVVPVGEDHLYENCPCQPWENEVGTIVHNSFDGREAYERGERKPS